MKDNTHSHFVKMELAVPVFLGALIALLFCALLAVKAASGLAGGTPENQELAADQMEDEPESEITMARFFTTAAPESQDIIQELYRETATRSWVIQFFAELCGSSEIATVILINADMFNIAPALAFALGWEESRFNPRAVNNRNRDESIDRGLFQLNNRSFPDLETHAFFNPGINAYYGMGHLRHCLNTGGTEIAALAMYNAGTGRVKSSGAPKITLDYVDRILGNRRKIEMRFRTNIRKEAESIAAEESRYLGQAENIPPTEVEFILHEFSEKMADAKPARSRLALLAPLAAPENF
jgi:soluble lytic murein transglycosylase-like protein